MVYVEHLTGWPVVRATERATTIEVKLFMEEDIISPFGAPKIIISDNAMCFSFHELHDIMEKHGAEWRTVLAYAPMSNGRAERMVGTIKRGIGRLLTSGNSQWDEVM